MENSLVYLEVRDQQQDKELEEGWGRDKALGLFEIKNKMSLTSSYKALNVDEE